MLETLLHLDGAILLFIQEHLRIEVLNPVITFITGLGNAGLFWIVLTALLVCFPQTRKAGIVSACALLGSLLVNNLFLKNVVGRIRPYEVVDGLIPLVGKQIDASFPSGHAGSSFASAVALYLNLPKKFGIPAVVLAVLISLSRLYVGVHYPSDVICGAVIGIVLAFLAQWIVEKFWRRDDDIGRLLR